VKTTLANHAANALVGCPIIAACWVVTDGLPIGLAAVAYAALWLFGWVVAAGDAMQRLRQEGRLWRSAWDATGGRAARAGLGVLALGLGFAALVVVMARAS
jgi:hypothetical protein